MSELLSEHQRVWAAGGKAPCQKQTPAERGTRFRSLASSTNLQMKMGHAYAGRSTQALIQATRSVSQGPAPGYDLTLRERGVLARLVEGLYNPEIAERLTVSRSTAAAQTSSILSKLGVANRTEAITVVFRHKLVT